MKTKMNRKDVAREMTKINGDYGIALKILVCVQIYVMHMSEQQYYSIFL
jgi:hypothetical protein